MACWSTTTCWKWTGRTWLGWRTRLSGWWSRREGTSSPSPSFQHISTTVLWKSKLQHFCYIWFHIAAFQTPWCENWWTILCQISEMNHSVWEWDAAWKMRSIPHVCRQHFQQMQKVFQPKDIQNIRNKSEHPSLLFVSLFCRLVLPQSENGR